MHAWGDLLVGDFLFHWHDGQSTEIHTFPDEMVKEYPKNLDWIWKDGGDYKRQVENYKKSNLG